ncbi:MAG: thiamine pyrophosphate-dependent dehydrogenase E1 component subunit alpha [Verrucomicrobiales bacterium]|nr:thiamine pyrophosphate-dependent dehydrogenase E1 component subunit alpha [Verrucomicrobiales bacterium]
MILARTLEDKIAALYRSGKIVGGVYVGRGQEAFSAALGMHLDQAKGDIFGPLIRDQAGRLAFGEPMIDTPRTYLGSVEGPMRGRDGNIHRGRPRRGQPAMISHLGSMTSVINGMLIAKRMRKESGFVGATTCGDGGTSTGAFHEGLNQAAVENLPLIVAVADNQYAYSTPTDRQFACDDLADRAIGYGVRGYSIDGTDLQACLDTFAEAVDRARGGEGPQLVVGKLLRLAGHGEHDDASYIPDQVRHSEHSRDCMEVARKEILANQWLSLEDIAEIESRIQQRVEESVGRAQSENGPSPFNESWHCLAAKHLSEGSPE